MEKLIPLTDKQLIVNHLTSTEIITPSYLSYERKAGFQDYGVNGFKIKQNLINAWRKFMFSRSINEVETPIITPFNVLKNSGHVDRFNDLVINDKFGINHRADHLIENAGLKCDLTNLEELERLIKDNKLIEFNDDSKVKSQNLMIKADDDFLRPEIAQGIFVNFENYLNYHTKLPFGIAQTGRSYRKEITPYPLTRLREFTQAEIEYFFDPLDDEHKEFSKIKHLQMPLLTSDDQLNNKDLKMISIEEALNEKLICNQIMAVFLGKIKLFTDYIGLNNIRFRQHLPDEKAHYSIECWDLECFVNNKWLECVGLAHRGSYDLTAHKFKGIKRSTYKVNKKKQLVLKNVNKSIIKEVVLRINQSTPTDDIIKEFDLPETCYLITEEKIYDTFMPNVIEPSFGIDRLMYALLSQNIYQRKDDINRLVLTLNQNISPFKLSVFQLSNSEKFDNYVEDIVKFFEDKNIPVFTEFASVNIGKRYVRSDELGIPFAVTVDFKTLEDHTVTIRNITDMSQIRIKVSEIINFV
jgi:glycyl-tRNA synthetase